MYNIDDNLLSNEELDNSSLSKWNEKPLIKIGKLLNYISSLEGQDTSIDNELKRLEELKKNNQRKIKNIKSYILTLMDDKPLIIGTYTISKRRTQAVEILDETKVPEEFKEQKITYTISKTKIKDYLSKDVINEETGEITEINCDFARLKNNENLIIK